MKDEWILDVIADLKRFADENGLTDLAEQLEQTQAVATIEIVGAPAAPIGRPHRDGGHVGTQHRAHPPRGNA